MPRMQVDLPGCIFWGASDTASDVNIKNLSIHGLSFQSRKYFSQGTPFQLLFPDQSEELKKKNIRAEVVRCEILNGVSDQKFRVGAKFLFESKFYPAPKKNLSLEKKSPLLKPYHPSESVDNGMAPPSPALTVKAGEIKAEYLQFIKTSQGEEKVHTLLRIKESHFTTSLSPASAQALSDKFAREFEMKKFFKPKGSASKRLNDPR